MSFAVRTIRVARLIAHRHSAKQQSRSAEDLLSGSLKKKPGAGSLPPGYRHPLHRGVIGLLPKHHPTRFSCLSNWTKVQPVRKSLLPAFYRRTQTLREHHQIACKALGFRCTSEYERLALLHDPRRTRTHRRSHPIITLCLAMDPLDNNYSAKEERLDKVVDGVE